MQRVVIIGGGLGGLAAAVYLAARDYRVLVLEKNNHLGGKQMPFELGSYHFDFGPNTITMPQVFQQVFYDAGEDPDSYLDFIKIEHHTRNIFAGGQYLVFSTDRDYMKEQLSYIDPPGAIAYDRYLAEIERIYQLAHSQFFFRVLASWKDYTDPQLALSLLQVRPLQNMASFHRQYFRNPLVLQAFNRYATYIGSSPYSCPATFALIAYLELVQGVFYVRGGNTRIARSLVQLGKKLGVEYLTDTTAKKILVRDKKARGVLTADETFIPADWVIVNADLLQVLPQMVEDEHRPHFSNKRIARYEPSISAFVILAGLRRRTAGMFHHQVYFSRDYEDEFRQLFDRKEYARDPTIYISNSSVTDPAVSPQGDNLFIMVNAPALTPENEKVDAGFYKDLIYQHLEHFGLSLSPFVQVEKTFTPTWIAQKFGAHRGALYGVSSNRRSDAFLRPGNMSRDISNLCFAGGSTHPGGGSPMVVISGKNVAHRIINRVKS